MEQVLKVRLAQSEWDQLAAYSEREELTKSDVVRQTLAAMGVITIAEAASKKDTKK